MKFSHNLFEVMYHFLIPPFGSLWDFTHRSALTLVQVVMLKHQDGSELIANVED